MRRLQLHSSRGLPLDRGPDLRQIYADHKYYYMVLDFGFVPLAALFIVHIWCDNVINKGPFDLEEKHRNFRGFQFYRKISYEAL